MERQLQRESRSLGQPAQELFDLVNESHVAMSQGHGKDVAGDVLRRLIDYTVHHFSAEEMLMQKHNFPGLIAHRAEHKALTDKVMAFKKEFDAGTGNVTPQSDDLSAAVAEEPYSDGRSALRRFPEQPRRALRRFAWLAQATLVEAPRDELAFKIFPVRMLTSSGPSQGAVRFSRFSPEML